MCGIVSLTATGCVRLRRFGTTKRALRENAASVMHSRPGVDVGNIFFGYAVWGRAILVGARCKRRRARECGVQIGWSDAVERACECFR